MSLNITEFYCNPKFFISIIVSNGKCILEIENK